MSRFRENEKGFSAVEILLVVFVLVVIVIVGYFVVNRSDKQKTNPNFNPIALGTFSYNSFEFPRLPSDFTIKGKSALSLGDTYVSYLNSKTLPQIEIEITNICKGNNYQPGGFNGGPVVGPNTDHETLCADNRVNTSDGWQFDITTSNKPKTWMVTVTENSAVGCTGSFSFNDTNSCSSPPCKTITVYGDSTCINK